MATTIAVAILGALGAALGTWQGWRKGQAEGEKTAREADVVAATYYSQTIEAQNTRLVSLEARVVESDRLLLDLRRTLLDVQSRQLRDEAFRSRAEEELHRVYTWVEQGSLPPPPSRPAWVQPTLED